MSAFVPNVAPMSTAAAVPIDAALLRLISSFTCVQAPAFSALVAKPP